MTNNKENTSPNTELPYDLPFDSIDELQSAIWHHDSRIFEKLTGSQRTRLAEQLDWGSFDFPKRKVPPRNNFQCRHGVILEKKRKEALSMLASDGTVYKLGDVVTGEYKPRGFRQTARTVTKRVVGINSVSLTLARLPTMSNVPKLPRLNPDTTDVEKLKDGDLRGYRQRLSENGDTDYPIPEEISGWKLETTDTSSWNEDCEPLVTEIRYNNGDNIYITAQWRWSYNCWYISTPTPTEEGIITDANEDIYNYEIDVPQEVITLPAVLGLVKLAAQRIDTEDHQTPFDLRSAEITDEPERNKTTQLPFTLPGQIGDWERTEYYPNRVTWENTDENSPWHGFELRLNSGGSVTIWNRNPDRAKIHDGQDTYPRLPSGDLNPNCIDGAKEMEGRYRDRFMEYCWSAFSFLINTSRISPHPDILTTLNFHCPHDTPVQELEHGFSTNAYDTQERNTARLTDFA